ncbi:uncharacterized protein LOC108850518 [Raphanus sativus]|uniref:Uncharacterized protein LOC108850518 n=1 Tax=Raphanus sativus TaxID=3726 RepID=A0A6J0N4F6_RAPSA|nr:uncharacterized protein LOC108850518 [Raphanus sativus]
MGKVIGNGRSTKVWKDSWVSLTQRTLPCGTTTEDDNDLRVFDLLTTELSCNRKRIEEVIPALAPMILSLQPSISGAEDSYFWYPTRNGIYSVKSGYHSIKGPSATPASNQSDFNWIKDVWNGAFSPKMKTFLWTTIQKAIPLGANLQSRGVTQEVKCIRCGQIETETHIFFTCEFAMKVWDYIQLKQLIDIAILRDVASALVAFRNNRCLSPLGVTTPILPLILWALWTARNVVIFEQRSYTVEETAIRVIKLAREWSQAQSHKKESSTTTQGSNFVLPHLGSPLPPPIGTTIIKTDAAWDKKSQTTGLAWIDAGPPSYRIMQGARIHRNVASPLAAEALAIRTALQDATASKVSLLRTYSDNQTLIRAINGKLFEKEIYGILKDIETLSSLFVESSFCFLSRAKNGQADFLAKSILRNLLCVMGRSLSI